MSTHSTFMVKKVLVLFALLICSFSYALDYVNLIPNGDFEDGLTGWGGAVLNLTIDGKNVQAGTNNMWALNRITLKPNTTYNVRCSFMEKNGLEGLDDALFGIVMYDAAGNEITNISPDTSHPKGLAYSSWKGVWYQYLPYFDPVTSWNKVTFNFTTGNNVAEGTIKLIRLDTTKTYYYDTVELVERPYADFNGDFEAGTAGWNGTVLDVTVAGRTTKAGSNDMISHYKIKLNPNTTYNVRCAFKEKDGIEGRQSSFFGIVLYDGAGNEITDTSPVTQQPEGLYYTYWNGRNAWYKYFDYSDNEIPWNTTSFTFTTGDNVRYGKIKLFCVNGTYYYEKISLQPALYAENIYNGSFEEVYRWNDGWKFGWAKSFGNMEIIDSTNNGFGNHFLRITGDAYYDRGKVAAYDDIVVTPNARYTISALLRADKIPTSTDTALFGIEFYDKDHNKLISGSSLSYSSWSLLEMHYNLIKKENFNLQWQPWQLSFTVPALAYSAKIYFYKYCNDQNGNPTYIDLDNISLARGDQAAGGNFGFESVTDNIINLFTGSYILNTDAFNGAYAMEVSDGNRAESAYIPVENSGYYLFRTQVKEPVEVAGYNTVYFTIQAFDADKNSLGQTVTVANMKKHYDGIRWYSYLSGTAIDSNFEPNANWQRYEHWFKVPATAKFIKYRLWNSCNGYSTCFDNTEIRQLKYHTATQTGTKSMVLWYGSFKPTWPPSVYLPSDKVKAFYPYIAHASDATLLNFDQWMIESILFMSSIPAQTPAGWNSYLDTVFANTPNGLNWLINLQQAVTDVGNKLGDSTHKIKVIISVPIDAEIFDLNNFASVVSSPVTNKKVADWYYNNVITRWNSIKNSVPRLNLLGFYCEDERPESSAYQFLNELSANFKAGGYKFYNSPYSSKVSITVNNEPKYRDVSGVSYFLPQYFDTAFVQPNYFFYYSDRAESLVDYSIIWAGLNDSSLNLEWTSNDGRFASYLSKADEYGLQAQDTSYMIFEAAGWLYYCATTSGTRRELYDKLNDLLHNNYSNP